MQPYEYMFMLYYLIFACKRSISANSRLRFKKIINSNVAITTITVIMPILFREYMNPLRSIVASIAGALAIMVNIVNGIGLRRVRPAAYVKTSFGSPGIR